jgi:hypothetical protein
MKDTERDPMEEKDEPKKRKPQPMLILGILVAIFCVNLLHLRMTRSPLAILDYDVRIPQNEIVKIDFKPEGGLVKLKDATIFIVDDRHSMESKSKVLFDHLFETRETSGGTDIVNDVVVSFPDIVVNVEVKGVKKVIARFWNASIFVAADTESQALEIGRLVQPRSTAIERVINRIQYLLFERT